MYYNVYLTCYCESYFPDIETLLVWRLLYRSYRVGNKNNAFPDSLRIILSRKIHRMFLTKAATF